MSWQVLILSFWLMSYLATPAMAGGQVDAGLVEIRIQDRFDTCATPVLGLCLFQWEWDGHVGSIEVDAYQRIEYIGVATNAAPVKHILGDVIVLPDAALRIRGSDLFVPHPTLVILTEQWSRMEHPSETERLELTEEDAAVRHPSPAMGHPESWQDSRWSLKYGKRIGYRQFGPYDEATGNSTDNYQTQVRERFCAEGGSRCQPLIHQALQAPSPLLPNARVGLEWYDVEVATDPAGLVGPARQTMDSQVEANGSSGRVFSTSDTLDKINLSAGGGKSGDKPQERHVAALPRAIELPQPVPPPVKLQSAPQKSQPPDSPAKLLIGVAATGVILAALGVGLYSRFNSRRDVLRSQARERILRLIQENPGIHLANLTAQANLSRSTTEHHLRILERFQLVRWVREGKLKVYFPTGRLETPPPPAWLCRNKTCVAIMTALQATAEGLSREEIHSLLPGIPERTRNYHLQRLLSLGAILQVEDQGRKVLRISPVWSRPG